MTNHMLSNSNVPPIFPLDTIGQGQQRLILSDESFQPNGSYTNRFGIYSTPNPKPGRVGELNLTRIVSPSGNNNVVEFQFKKQHTAGKSVAIGRFTPAAWNSMEWSFYSHTETSNGTILPATQLSKSFVTMGTENDVTKISALTQMNDGSERSDEIAVQGSIFLSWSLFDSVQRLPGAGMEPFHFTLIDHFDQIKPGHTLRCRGTVDVPVEGKTVPMTVYDQTGRGVLPLTYYVDPNGRLAAMVSGIEAYIREPVEE